MAKRPPAAAGTDTMDVERLQPADFKNFEVTSSSPDQQPLFASDELVPRAVGAEIRKGVALLHSIPVTPEYNHTLNSRRLMDALATLVQLDFRKRPVAEQELLRRLEASPAFRVRTSELSKLAGIKGQNFQRIGKELDKLVSMLLQWNVLGQDEAIEWQMKANFLSLVAVGKEGGPGHGQVMFAMDPRVMNLVLQPKVWASLSLEAMHRLGTEPAYALYQIVWRYIDSPRKLTARLPVYTWIELLMGHSRHVRVDPETKEKEVLDYADFKRRALVPAMERINRLAALSHIVELIEVTSGRRVLELQFRLVPKGPQELLDLPLTWPESTILELKGFGYNDQDLARLSEAYDLREIHEAQKRFAQAALRKSKAKERITSPRAFFNAILANIKSETPLDDAGLAALEKDAAREEKERLTEQGHRMANERFAQRQTRVLRENLQAWPEERRTKLLAAFEASTTFSQFKLLVNRTGWDSASVGAFVGLKTWLQKFRQDDYLALLPEPEDRSLADWLIWEHARAAPELDLGDEGDVGPSEPDQA